MGMQNLYMPTKKALTPAYLRHLLFANGEQGAWYAPTPATVYQDSAGSIQGAKDQPVGMNLDQRLGLVRGSELVSANYATPATFDNTTNVISASAFSATAGTTATRSYLDLATIAGEWYEVFSTLDSLSGGAVTLFARDGSGGAGTILAQVAMVVGSQARLIFQATSATSTLLWSTGTVVDLSVSGNSVKSLPGNHATQSTADSRPTLRQDATTGLYYLELGGDDFMTIPGSASTLKFMHDGAGGLFAGAVQFGAVADPNTIYSLVSSRVSTSTSRGFSLFWDDRAASSRNDAMFVVLSNGTSESTGVADNVITAATPKVVRVTAAANVESFVNGSTAIAPFTNTSPSTSDSASDFNLFRAPTSGFHMAGRFYGGIFAPIPNGLPASTAAQIDRYFARLGGIPL